MDFLQLTDKTIVVFGVANRKSVAFYIGALLKTCGAKVIYVVRSQERYESLTKLLAGEEVFICDVEHDEQIQRLRQTNRRAPQCCARTRPFHRFC